MTGLREKKKDARRSRILQSALEVFSEVGFEAATMAQIAGRAELGVGTLYNYYSSKGDLLVGIIAFNASDYIEDMNRVVTSEELPPIAKIEQLAMIYLKSFSTYSKRIWREFTAFALSNQPHLLLGIKKMDQPFVENLSKVLGENCAKTFYAVWMHRLLEFMADDALSADAFLQALYEDIRVVLR